ncbi:apolipoprotein N-acyltransferase [Halarcobacter mediterraneus]|uniref:Apolipoprotein N-acyltransferase n=1 Tax=Halarcobacter mediterraneus TaxID=2023153 RepID=A0A4Q1AVS4_9BACT|nr:apolipoprotein N-acyltransferase [Halarcobacter mediterraneus]RXK13161.1 apolipoprotein N-acyltransferase [Halarcobacter mediterraneus]
MFLVKREHFNKTNIIKGLLTAIFLSSFIYLEHYAIEQKLLNTFLALFSFYLLLTIDKKSFVYTGFFVGILWFYWIGNSFQYYNLAYLKYPMILLIALGYSLIFYFMTIIDKTIFRVFTIFIVSFIHPLGFNWFIPELSFVNSYLPFSKPYFALILALIYMFIKLQRFQKLLAFIPLLFIFSNKGIYIDNTNLTISMPQMNVSQNQKWHEENLALIIDNNFNLIDKAILEENDLIILPETIFPVVLNKENFLLDKLLKKSHKINIILGALYYEEGNYYNATYHFKNGNIKVAKKVVLVPFGEKIPLPKFLVDFINEKFYNGAQDYVTAKEPTDFIINNTKFRNAICYEATTDKIFENLNDIKYMIVTSNNAWFTPSIEPTLQKLLLKYYAKKYDITIFHSVNGSSNYVIRP